MKSIIYNEPRIHNKLSCPLNKTVTVPFMFKILFLPLGSRLLLHQRFPRPGPSRHYAKPFSEKLFVVRFSPTDSGWTLFPAGLSLHPFSIDDSHSPFSPYVAFYYFPSQALALECCNSLLRFYVFAPGLPRRLVPPDAKKYLFEAVHNCKNRHGFSSKSFDYTDSRGLTAFRNVQPNSVISGVNGPLWVASNLEGLRLN